MGEIKNYGKSNRTKLLNLSRQTKGADYNLILLRFVQERFSRTQLLCLQLEKLPMSAGHAQKKVSFW